MRVPDDIDALCCGVPWSSKGLPGGQQAMREVVARTVGAVVGTRRVDVISDASSCTEGYLEALQDSGLEVTVTDAVQFVADRVLPLLPEGERLASLSLHPTCSSTRLGSNAALATIGAAVAEEVHLPVDWGCCGFAGDRGMLHPELTASATAAEAVEVRGSGRGGPCLVQPDLRDRDVPCDRPHVPAPGRAPRGGHPTRPGRARGLAGMTGGRARRGSRPRAVRRVLRR